jgi:phage portal protein BeeE
VPRKRIKRLAETCGAGKSALLDATESSGEIEEVTEHPLLDLLRKPEDATNDGGLSAYDHRWLTQCLLESVGVAYLYIAERNEFGQPKRLLILRSQLVRPIPDTTGERYIIRYEYGTAKIDPADIIRFALPDPANPHYNVLSPMRAAIEKIRLVRGGDAFMTALLENGGYPAGVWSPKGDSEGGGVGETIQRRMASEFRRSFAQANAGRIFVSESPGQLQTLAWKPAEIIDVERAKELIGEIADCFDVPRTKIFRDSSNRASGEQGDVDHARDAGISRCSRFEEVINGQLVPLFDDSGRLFVAFDSPVKDDRTMILEEAKAGAQLGLTNIDEGRSALGMDPLDDDLGESRLIPGTMVLLGKDGEATPLVPPAPPANAANGKPVDQPAPRKPKKSRRSDINELARVLRKALAPKKVAAAPSVRDRLLAANYSDQEADELLSRRANGHAHSHL